MNIASVVNTPCNRDNASISRYTLPNHSVSRKDRQRGSKSRKSNTAFSETSTMNFSETSLSKLLEGSGFRIEQDFEVQSRSSAPRKTRPSTNKLEKKTNKPAKTKTEHSIHQKQTDDHSISSVSFSSTVLGQLLAKEGFLTTKDFEVTCKGSKKHFYANLVKSPPPGNSRPIRATKVLPCYPTRNEKLEAHNETEKITQRRDIKTTTSPTEYFEHEFDGDSLLLTEFLQTLKTEPSLASSFSSLSSDDFSAEDLSLFDDLCHELRDSIGGVIPSQEHLSRLMRLRGVIVAFFWHIRFWKS